MDLIIIFLTGFVATSLFTGFSYLVAFYKESQFKEPQLLNLMINRLRILPGELSRTSSPGWIIHYGIGWIFVFFFHLAWRHTPLEPTFFSGLLLGALAGIIGIGGWKLMFRFHPDKPVIPYKTFYIQLMVAHLIFGTAAALIYGLW